MSRGRRIALATAGIGAVQWVPGSFAAMSPWVASAIGIPTRLPSERGVLLTFDDGPDPLGTPAVLEVLEAARAPAVFFVTGEQATRSPSLVAELIARGHEVGIHGHRHQTRRQWTPRLLKDDTLRALDAVSRAAEVTPRLYRPPHGVFSSTGLRTIRRLGLAPLLWSKWGRDWQRRATAATIACRATAGVRAGDVLLLHDADRYGTRESWRQTASALELIFSGLAEARLEPSSIVDRTVSTVLTLSH